VHAGALGGGGGRSSIGLDEGRGSWGVQLSGAEIARSPCEMPACSGQLVGETESSCVAAAAALKVYADVCQR